MIGLLQVAELMNDDIVDAIRRGTDQIQIQRQKTRWRQTTPALFKPLDDQPRSLMLLEPLHALAQALAKYHIRSFSIPTPQEPFGQTRILIAARPDSLA